MAQQIVHGGFVGIFELQVRVLDVPHYQALALQIRPDPLTDGLDEGLQAPPDRRPGTTKNQAFLPNDDHPIEEQHVKMFAFSALPNC
jgi:hypothetical protein